MASAGDALHPNHRADHFNFLYLPSPSLMRQQEKLCWLGGSLSVGKKLARSRHRTCLYFLTPIRIGKRSASRGGGSRSLELVLTPSYFMAQAKTNLTLVSPVTGLCLSTGLSPVNISLFLRAISSPWSGSKVAKPWLTSFWMA